MPNHGMATLNWRTPPAGAAPKNGAQAGHQHRHHHHHQRLPAVVPNKGYGFYETTTPAVTSIRHHSHTPQSALEEEEDDLSEITIQFDDGVQTLYVGPVEIVDNKGAGDANKGSTNVPAAKVKNGGGSNDNANGGSSSALRSRERFQEEKAIVTLEPVGGSRTKGQLLPLYLQQQQQQQLHQQNVRQLEHRQQPQKTPMQQQKQQQKLEQQQVKLKQQSLQQHVQKLQESQQRHQQRQQQLTELQLTVSVQEQSALHQPARHSKHSNKRQPDRQTQQQAVLYQRQQHQLLQLVQQPAQQPAQQPTPHSQPKQSLQKACIRQAPMLNFARAGNTTTSTIITPTIGSVGNRPPLAAHHHAPVATMRDVTHGRVSSVSTVRHTVLPVVTIPGGSNNRDPVATMATIRDDRSSSNRVPSATSPPQATVLLAAKQLRTAVAALSPHILTAIKQEPTSELEASSNESIQHHHQNGQQSVLAKEKPSSLATAPEAALSPTNGDASYIPTEATTNTSSRAVGNSLTVVGDVAEKPSAVPATVTDTRSEHNEAAGGTDDSEANVVQGRLSDRVHTAANELQKNSSKNNLHLKLAEAFVNNVASHLPRIKRGRGRPPKAANALQPLELVTVKQALISTHQSLINHSSNAAEEVAKPTESEAVHEKAYISVAALFKLKGDRKRIRQEPTDNNGVQVPVAKEAIADAGVVAGTEDENKTEINNSTVVAAVPAAGASIVNGGDTVKVTNIHEEIKVRAVSPLEEREVVASCELQAERPEDDGRSVGKESSKPVDVLEVEKESSPGRDSGIESVSDSTLTGKKQYPSRGRPKSSLSVVSEEEREAVQLQSQKQQQQEEAEQHHEQHGDDGDNHFPSIRKSSSPIGSDDNEDDSTKGLKRPVRTSRKPSAKAKEAAEAAQEAQSVAMSCGDDIQCRKCDMSFKTGAWYRKHLMNAHELDPQQIAHLLSLLVGFEDDELPEEADGIEDIAGIANDINEHNLKAPATSGNEKLTPEIALSEGERTKVSKKELAGRKRRSTISSEEGASAGKRALLVNEPSSSSSSPVPHTSRRSLPTPPHQNGDKSEVKVERRASNLRQRNKVETFPSADEDDVESDNEGSYSKPLANAITPKVRAGSSLSKSSKAELLSATKQERLEANEPDPDPGKLTPFEEAKVAVLESEDGTGEIHFKCTICDGQFSEMGAIKDHLSTVHAAIKRRSCEHCGRTFVQTGDLTRHVRIHTGYRPFKCPYVECSYAFISSGDLHKHVRRHNTDQPFPKPHVCDECGKDFERSYDLKRHKTMHLKQQPGFEGITCDVCGKVFARKDQYRAHTYRHMGVRPYQCEVCGKAFTDPSNYSKHARLHELDGVEVVCDFCGRPFKNKSAISKHIFHCQQKTVGRKALAKAGVTAGGNVPSSSLLGKKNIRKGGSVKESRRVGRAPGFGKELKLKEEPGRKRKRRRARSVSTSTSEEDDDTSDGHESSNSANHNGRLANGAGGAEARRRTNKNGVLEPVA